MSKQNNLMDFAIDNDTQSIKELWESVAKMGSHVVNDNIKSDGDYPLSVREIQLTSLKTLVTAIEKTHHALAIDAKLTESEASK